MRDYNKRMSSHQRALYRYMVDLSRKYFNVDWLPGFTIELAEAMAGEGKWEIYRSEIKHLGTLSQEAGGWFIDFRHGERSAQIGFHARFVTFDEMRNISAETVRLAELLRVYRSRGTV